MLKFGGLVCAVLLLASCAADQQMVPAEEGCTKQGDSSGVRAQMPQPARFGATSLGLCVDDQYCEHGPSQVLELNRPNWRADRVFFLGVALLDLDLQDGSVEHTPPSFGQVHTLRVTYLDELEQPVKVFSTPVKLHRATVNGFVGGRISEPCSPIIQYRATEVTETGRWRELPDESLDNKRF